MARPSVEIIHPNPASGPPRVALFDFDGTVSLLRSGWIQLMIKFMAEAIPEPRGEPLGAMALAVELVHSTNGQATIQQMERLAQVVRSRGAEPLEDSAYKRIYQNRLERIVQPRLAAVESHAQTAESWQVPGIESFLESLHACSLPCYLASGTDDAAVRKEAAALGLDRFFVGIYGATVDVHNSTKAAVIERLSREHRLQAHELVVFGDGAEELRLAREYAALAIGAAGDDNSSGEIDDEQRARLIAAGADAIIADFRPRDQLLQYLQLPYALSAI